ncbi:hypothetical protein VU08_07980 [Desulfobulbus sp. F5]|nr:hypothetical protein [Desulfobulbus sp. F5]
MAAPEIEISKDGLKLSYQRYLADSTAGFMVILAVLFVISKGYPLPFFGHSLESLLKLSDTVQLFIFLFIFLLATPIGLLIHQLSWFMFGWFEIVPIKLLFKTDRNMYNPIFLTKQLFNYDDLDKFFKINSENKDDTGEIYSEYRIYKEYSLMFFPEYSVEHICGLLFFVRNTAFLSLVSLLSVLHVMLWDASVNFSIPIPFALLASTILFSLLYSLIEIFRCLKTLSTVYLLCVAKGITNEEGDSPRDLIKKIHAAYFDQTNGSEN